MARASAATRNRQGSPRTPISSPSSRCDDRANLFVASPRPDRAAPRRRGKRGSATLPAGARPANFTLLKLAAMICAPLDLRHDETKGVERPGDLSLVVAHQRDRRSGVRNLGQRVGQSRRPKAATAARSPWPDVARITASNVRGAARRRLADSSRRGCWLYRFDARVQPNALSAAAWPRAPPTKDCMPSRGVTNRL